MYGHKKRKVDNECRLFNEEWGIKYFFVQSQSKGKVICLICKDTVAVLKEYNIRRHYETKHASTYSQFKENQRSEKFELLRRCLHSQQDIFNKANCENEALTLVSYKLAYILAKRGKPFTDGDIIKECMLEAVAELCPKKSNLFKLISLAPNTIARRIENMESSIIQQVVRKAQHFRWYSLALDESTDVCDTSQLLVFIRGVDNDLNVTQELASLHSMHGTVTGADIFKELEKTRGAYDLDWCRLQCVTVDGGRNMSGINNGLFGQITKACQVAEVSKPMFLHCILHQQALCGKHFDMNCVLKPVVSMVNFIRSRALNHRMFRSFIEECDSEFVDLPFFTSVRWLSCGKVLSRFFHLRNEIHIFLTEKKYLEPLLSDTEWLWKLAFIADLVGHMNILNLKMQGENNLVCDLFDHIKAFKAKLILLDGHVKSCNFAHLPCCAELEKESEAEFPSSFANSVISDLKQQFQKRFADFDAHANEIRMFQNPFDCDVTDVPNYMQMDIIDLQENGHIKDKYKELSLIDFYRYLKPEEFPNLKEFACRYISIFGTTYVCEQTFSKMHYIKSKHRANLSDEHLRSLLLISVSKHEPQIDEILKTKKQLHHSH